MKLCPSCKNIYPVDYQVCPRDQTTLGPLGTEIVPGTILRGKYELIAELGAGGMATVHKARHLAFQDFAAVKIVHSHLMHDADFLKRFRNEAVVARQLRHPNAVRIDDFDSMEDGRPFIVMEFVDGSSLEQLCKANPGAWPVERALAIASQVVEALQAAHALGIVHRDIKPSNIILPRSTGREGEVKVLDFGIAKVSNPVFDGLTSVLTRPSLLIGTPEYMSPEQINGSNGNGLDGRADLYSLGLILYEMLTGSHPFHAENPLGMLLHQVNTQPVSPGTLCPEISPAVSALVLKALSKDPNERFQTAHEMLQALRSPGSWYTAETEPATGKNAPLLTQNESSSPISVPENSSPAKTIAAQQPDRSTSILSAKKTGITFAAFAIVMIAIAAATFFSHRNRTNTPPISIRQQSPASPQPVSSTVQTSVSPSPSPSNQTPSVPVVKPAPAKPILPKQPEPKHPPQKSNNQPVPESKPAPPPVLPAPAPEIAKEPPPTIPVAKVDANALLKQSIALIREEKYNEAFPLSKSACDAGSLAACVSQGYLLENGKGTPQNYEQAVALFRKGCDGGNSLGCSNLGNMYEHSRGVPLDFNQAFTLYRKSCDAGNAHGCSNLGHLYETGKGVTPDYTQAVAAYRKGCDGGFLLACSSLGLLTQSGRGTPRDYDQAVTLYEKSCNGTIPQGCSNLGLMYMEGKGVKRDYARANLLFRKGCDDGYAHSCANLGFMYAEGKGVSRDYVQAVPLFQKSCDGGYGPGCANLAYMYQSGQGVPRDNPRAATLYRKGCELGFQPACSKADQNPR